jgi:hypothetical protein
MRPSTSEIRDIMEKKVLITCDAYELEKIIKKEFGHNFELNCDIEGSNDCRHTFGVEKECPYDSEYDRKELAEWIATGKGSYMTRHILNELCRRGKLEAGEYLVDTSW